VFFCPDRGKIVFFFVQIGEKFVFFGRQAIGRQAVLSYAFYFPFFTQKERERENGKTGEKKRENGKRRRPWSRPLGGI
jgi:hypothetical protein